jgi:hypothetical protein
LIPLQHALLSPFANPFLNLVFASLHALFSPFANLFLNLTFVFFIALLSLGDLFFASKLLDLDYMFYYH